jgi:ATP-dependent Clp protease adaptor protein ClpS
MRRPPRRSIVRCVAAGRVVAVRTGVPVRLRECGLAGQFHAPLWRSRRSAYRLPLERRAPCRDAGAEGCQTRVASIQMSSKLIQNEVQEAGRGRVPVRAASTPRNPGDDDRSGTAIITRTKPRAKRPSLYRVLLLNDDYTPMEFVVHVVERFFNKSHDDAYQIMMHVHHNGVGECGVFTYEVAETKVTQVMDFARKHQHPLQCVMEKK